MKSLGSFFEKFNNKIAKEVGNLVFISEAVKKHTGIEIDIKDIKISNGIIRVKGSALEKNEIFMKKTKIIKELEPKLRSLIVRDIQ
jgi:hypothetical protein